VGGRLVEVANWGVNVDGWFVSGGVKEGEGEISTGIVSSKGWFVVSIPVEEHAVRTKIIVR
jgi:hypothetical protein